MKLKALAERGEGGEKENAERMLNDLMGKYGFNAADLDDEVKVEFIFRYKTTREKRLIYQVLYKVVRNTDYDSYRYIGERNKIYAKLTKEQGVEAEFLFDFYKRLYKREEAFFYSSFLQKHRIFGEAREDYNPEPMSDEEFKKMQNLMNGMEDETPFKQIQGGK